MISATFPALLQSFFRDRLLRQRSVSPHTIAGYRDSFRLMLQFATQRLRKRPSDLRIEDLDAPLIGEFLEHLEKKRGNSPRTRNARLAAIHSFFQYVALAEPAHALHCQRILAIPTKRNERNGIDFLDLAEVEALLSAPDPATWIGRRDRLLLTVAVQTGLRVSELVGLRCQDAMLGTGAHLRSRGKGRKERCTPLRKDAAALLEPWLRERHGSPGDPLFPSIRGDSLSQDAVGQLVAKYASMAQKRCPSLKRKKVTPHVLRHTTAMELLQNGVDRSVIALWLGHESVETTQVYLHADMRLKEQALAHTSPLGIKPQRYRADDKLLVFLESL
ncbi:MAG: site-specific integrase [Chloroflexi bacterium]|nr:site-specific integrase [Chloroflexota bacterium]